MRAAILDRPLASRPTRGWWRRHRATSLLLLAAAPALLFLLVFYLLPMALLLSQSFEGGTLGAYEKALTDGLSVGVLLDTMRIAA